MSNNTERKWPITNEAIRMIKLAGKMSGMLWKNTPALWFYLAIAPVVLSALSMCTVLMPKYIVEAIQSGGTMVNVLILLGIMAISACVRMGIVEFGTRIIDTRYQRLSMLLRRQLIERYLSNTLDVIESNEENVKKNKALYAIEQSDVVRNYCNAHLMMMETLISLLISSTVIADTNALIIVLLLGATGLNIYLDSKRKGYDYKCWDLWANDISKVRTMISTAALPEIAKDVRIFRAKEFMMKNIDACNAMFTGKLAEKARHHLRVDMIEYAVDCVKNIALYLYSVILLYRGTISLGDFTAYIGVISKFIHSTTQMGGSLLGFKLFSGHLGDLMEYLDSKKNPTGTARKENSALQKIETIEFDHVSFRYPGHTEYAVKDVSFSVNAGEHWVLVGENGAGKSTLVKLLLGLYRPEKGRVLINNIDLATLPKEDILNMFSVMFQGEKAFPFSILENVCMTDKKHIHMQDEDKVTSILYALNVGEDIDRLPLKINTPLSNVYEGGINLSKGQTQKISIARLLFERRSVIVMDEPNAALDVKAEVDLNKLFCNEFELNTVICVSHRLTTVQTADRILVMHQGEIAESGTHKELICADGLYKKMFDAQASLYSKRPITLTDGTI